jgi:hypothetical protein
MLRDLLAFLAGACGIVLALGSAVNEERSRSSAGGVRNYSISSAFVFTRPAP